MVSDPSSVNAGIEALDREGMQLIEGQDCEGFHKYIQEEGNTICGRHPIQVFLEVLRHCRTKCSIRFVHYSQSGPLPATPTKADSCVSYASAICYLWLMSDCSSSVPSVSSVPSALRPPPPNAFSEDRRRGLVASRTNPLPTEAGVAFTRSLRGLYPDVPLENFEYAQRIVKYDAKIKALEARSRSGARKLAAVPISSLEAVKFAALGYGRPLPVLAEPARDTNKLSASASESQCQFTWKALTRRELKLSQRFKTPTDAYTRFRQQIVLQASCLRKV